MKITNLQAVNYINVVTAMKEKRLPIKLLFAINHNFNLIMNQVKTYEEARRTLLDKFEGDDQTKFKMALPEMEELLNESVEQPVKTIAFSDLEKIDNDSQYDKLTTVEYSAIFFMLEDK